MLCYSFSEKFIDLVSKVENGEITEEEFETLADALVSEEEVPEIVGREASLYGKPSEEIV